MKPLLAELKAACPGASESLLAEHIERLGEDYFAAFSPTEIRDHVAALARLSPEQPVQVLVDGADPEDVRCTVLAYDYPSEFSLIAGVLAGTGFNILAGQVFTYRKAAGAGGAGEPRRRIIDRLSGRLAPETPLHAWTEDVVRHLGDVAALLERGGEANLTAARHKVNELVAARFGRREDPRRFLYPVSIEVENESGPYTTLRVLSQDTPAFLYALSNALSLQGVSIERLTIRTEGGNVRDEIGILDSGGEKIRSEDRLDEIKVSVLLTKQFTYFLGRAPDPFSALVRFQRMCTDVLRSPDRRQWVELLSDAEALRGLARILGASDFIWEDFVRIQYEALTPILARRGEEGRTRWSPAEAAGRLDGALRDARDFEESRMRLNAFKDREIFLIDLGHILRGDLDVRDLAEPLTRLAELVVSRAGSTVYDWLRRRSGEPRTVAGLPARYAVFGLGKFGGEALGYASDIELLFVYSDSGRTSGAVSVENSEFFGRLAAETARFIAAKREGIFRVDLRLRPYGESGPAACSLESFCHYYGPSGPSHAYERLALTRLRFVAGDAELGRQVERLRDEIVYAGRGLELSEVRRLRGRQFEEKARGDRYNAKFSAGALVDLEYYVQVLQIAHGQADPSLRTPRIHEALDALGQVGVLRREESGRLTHAYYFLRRLINGLRMLRGNALDLVLPEAGSDEFLHLARRMGYAGERGLSPERRLHLDFETCTAAVRTFIEEHFGRETLPAPGLGNVADLILSPSPAPELKAQVLRRAGFRDAERAYLNLRRLAGEGRRRDAFAPLAVLAFDVLKREADPDMALNNWERFAQALADAGKHQALLLHQPRRLDILLSLFARSQFLSDALVKDPDFFDWTTDPANLHGTRDPAELAAGLRAFLGEAQDRSRFMDGIRRFRRRETLRIGVRDLCLGAPMEEITADLSVLAETLTAAALEWEWDSTERQQPEEGERLSERLCVLALGKLGGEELNYSSDIDLLAVYEESSEGGADSATEVFAKVMHGMRAALAEHTAEGYAYRVDFRLRPHGSSGALANSVRSLAEYYAGRAASWELQALLRARPVAGSERVGEQFLDAVRPIVSRGVEPREIGRSIGEMREKALRSLGGAGALDIKTGAGGIRDVEFLVQGLQLLHLRRHPQLWAGNTLQAVRLLQAQGILDAAQAAALREDYVFLRRVEHSLQILEDRQVHAMPEDAAGIANLARRVLGRDASAEQFTTRLASVRERARTRFEAFVSSPGS
jgi:glutamate-ammonia-ligase adenylyltransferase